VYSMFPVSLHCLHLVHSMFPVSLDCPFFIFLERLFSLFVNVALSQQQL
jgi:hypothetical protein